MRATWTVGAWNCSAGNGQIQALLRGCPIVGSPILALDCVKAPTPPRQAAAKRHSWANLTLICRANIQKPDAARTGTHQGMIRAWARHFVDRFDMRDEPATVPWPDVERKFH